MHFCFLLNVAIGIIVDDAKPRLETVRRELGGVAHLNDFDQWRATNVAVECCCPPAAAFPGKRSPKRRGGESNMRSFYANYFNIEPSRCEVSQKGSCPALKKSSSLQSRQSSRQSVDLWLCMSLKKESLDVKPFQIVYGRLSALNFGRYAIPDFAELQILFFTGRLLYLRQTLVFEFQDWPWSRRWAEWIKTRDSLVCWWGELQKKFSISTSFNVIDCLAQLEMAQLESQIAESSKSVGVSVGPLERRPRRFA